MSFGIKTEIKNLLTIWVKWMIKLVKCTIKLINYNKHVTLILNSIELFLMFSLFF